MKLVSILLLVSSLVAQSTQPTVVNAQLETSEFRNNLKQQIRSGTPAWFGYSVRTLRKQHQECCWNGYGSCGAHLEKGSENISGVVLRSPIALEGTDRESILIRVDTSGITRVRPYPSSCPLDVGNLPFTWIENVPSQASLAFLISLIEAAPREELLDGVLAAIAQHEDPNADKLLQSYSAASNPSHLRERSIFWLGAEREKRGIPFLKQLLINDPSEQIRDKTVFALSLTKQPESLEAIAQTARTDASSHVRGQALFWLAQAAGERAAAAIVNAIQNDPDTQVKERAVFALSQLPRDESVTRLIQVATDQRNPEVKKKAFFWLGQSHDPRALAYIEKVLSK
jgi:HEAT repeats